VGNELSSIITTWQFIMMSNLARYKNHYVKLLIAIVVLILFLKWAKIKDYSLILDSLGYARFWYGCLLLVFVQAIKTLRFHLMISEYDVRIPFGKNLLIHCTIPILGSVTPSHMGEAAKLFMIGEKKEKLGFCFILEKLSDLTILCVLALIGIFRFTILVDSIYLIVLFLLMVILGLIFFDRIFNVLFQRIMKRKLEKNWFLLNLRLFIKPKHLLTSISTILVWACTIFAAYNFALVVGFDISYWNFAPIIASSIIVGIVSGLPGGIGSRETTVGLLFSRVFRIELEKGGMFSLLNLFGNYLTFAVMGAISYSIFRRKYGKLITPP
jgi:uncharacterized protein (TIRG00374 family)